MNAYTPFIRDDFGIGQAKVAEIRMAHAIKAMAEAAPDILDTRDVTPEWRQMRIRQFVEAQAEHDRAHAVWIMTGGMH